ncbi:MAG: ribosomal RNA small subunit methyltransferase A [Candidatus Omnitrophica bacterium]|nr:ribosomal RNA small subunit methyltransferase A [Candidatus Omnitrophota bacterium]
MKNALPPLKRFGQNFLFDKNIIAKILKAVEVRKRDFILEIGPGQGNLTFELAKRSRRVLAVEIDRGLCANLEVAARDLKNIDIFCCDILKFDLKRTLKKRKIGIVKIVANLPYYITTPILEYLFENRRFIDDIFIMVQKEVAERVTSAPGTRVYGSLSCFVNYFCRPQVLFKIKGSSFYPAPKVDSCFIRLKPFREPQAFHGARSEALLFKIIRYAFGQRRKRLYGSLGRLFTKEELNGLPCRELLLRRPQELALLDFVRLSNLIFDISKRQ